METNELKCTDLRIGNYVNIIDKKNAELNELKKHITL